MEAPVPVYTPAVEALEARMEKAECPDPGLPDHLDFLESSGALDHLAELRKESRELDTLINDAAGLFALGEIEEMLSFVTTRLLDRFIPTNLVFLIELPDGGGVDQYSYRNMKPAAASFPLAYFRAFTDFFRDSPYSAPFSALEEKLGASRFGADIRAYEPEYLLPMSGIGGLFGVVILGSKVVGGEYSPLDRMYADRLTRFFAICLQNRLHRERSITDAKTGLYNHGYLVKRLDEELSYIARTGRPSALLMIDVDHFKAFNDTWGHLAGDEVLIAIARLLKRTIRAEDVAARYGGEEFCVLLVDCEEATLPEVAERIRLTVNGLKVRYRDEELSVSVSLGACPLDPSLRGNPTSYIERADQALYRSKAAGRNRSTIYRFGLLGRASALREAQAFAAPEALPAGPASLGGLGHTRGIARRP
jgi:diguanylate cyclase (GGDEF)-like protein